MKPKDIEQKISELVDGTLSADQAERVRQRLTADPRLAAEFRLHKALSAVLDDLAAEPMPLVDWELQRQTIQAAMERDALLRPPAAVWPRRVTRWAAAVTAAAAVFAMLVIGRGWLIGPLTSPEAPDLQVTWTMPASAAGGALTAGPIRPAAPAAAELVVAYSEPAGAAGGDGRPISALERPGRAGTIIISAAAATGAADWTWDDL